MIDSIAIQLFFFFFQINQIAPLLNVGTGVSEQDLQCEMESSKLNSAEKFAHNTNAQAGKVVKGDKS